MNRLVDLPILESYTLQKVDLPGSFRTRLLELGFVSGTPVMVIQKKPILGQLIVRIRNATFAIELSVAEKILVI